MTFLILSSPYPVSRAAKPEFRPQREARGDGISVEVQADAAVPIEDESVNGTPTAVACKFALFCQACARRFKDPLQL
jgi:hypothetical protein